MHAVRIFTRLEGETLVDVALGLVHGVMEESVVDGRAIFLVPFLKFQPLQGIAATHPFCLSSITIEINGCSVIIHCRRLAYVALIACFIALDQ